MEKKKLLSEVSRIHEIMGIDGKTLLKEQKGWAEIVEAIASGLKKVFNEAGQEVPLEVNNLLVKMSSLDAKEAAVGLEELITYIRKYGDLLGENMRRDLSNVLVRELVDAQGESLFRSISRRFAPGVAGGQKTIYDNLETLVKNGNTDDEILAFINTRYTPNTGNEVLDEFAKRKYIEQTRVSLSKIRNEVVPTPKVGGETPTGPKSDGEVPSGGRNEGGTPTPREEELLGIFDVRAWDGEFARLTEAEMRAIEKMAEKDPSLYQKYIGIWVESHEKRIKTIQRLVAAYERQVSTGKANADILRNLQRRIDSEMKLLAQQNMEAASNMYRWIDLSADAAIRKGDMSTATTLRTLSRNLKDEGKFYKEWGTVVAAAGKTPKTITQSWGALSDAFRRGTAPYRDVIRTVRNAFSKTKKLGDDLHIKLGYNSNKEAIEVIELAKKGVQGTEGRWSSEFWKKFITGSRRGFPTFDNPYYRKIISRFGYKTAFVSYVAEVFLTYLKYKAQIAVLKTLRDGIAFYIHDGGFQDCMAKVEEYKNSDDFDGTENIVDIMDKYPEVCDYQNPWFVWAANVAEGRPSKSFFEYFIGQVTDVEGWKITTLFPGFLDDILYHLRNLDDIIFKKATLEDVYRVFDVPIKELEEKANKVEQDFQDKVDGLGDKGSVSDEIPNDLLSEVPEEFHDEISVVNKEKDEYAIDFGELGGKLPIKKYNGIWEIKDDLAGGWIPLSGEDGFFYE